MLGRRGDATALPFIRQCLRSRDETVRLAAIPAAVRLGGRAVVPDLVGLIGAAGEDEAAALKTALLRFEAGDVVPEAARLIDSDAPSGEGRPHRPSRRKGRPQARSSASSPWPPTRIPRPGPPPSAPWPRLAGEGDLPRLVAMLEKAVGRRRHREPSESGGRRRGPRRRARDGAGPRSSSS